MLLWLVIAVGFVVCVIFWHFWHGITFAEAATLFVAAAIVFSIGLDFIYKEATEDKYLVSGYVTSMIHRPAFSYKCGRRSRCHEAERWIIEQKSHQPQNVSHIQRYVDHGAKEECFGECDIIYPAPYKEKCCVGSKTILVNPEKFSRTKIGDTSTVWQSYFNPVQISDEIIYNDSKNHIPYFALNDFNRAHRLLAPNATKKQEAKLEEINAQLQNRQNNISLGLIITSDNLYFEKLRRAWHQGKANDFVIVVNTADGKIVRNVNVLGWDNYALKENVAKAIMALPADDIDLMLTTINENFDNQKFYTIDFSKYNFVNVKIPDKYYWKILIFQTLFFAYMLSLMHFNPNTKDHKLETAQVLKMWNKHFSPPSKNWYLHPLTPSGLFLYIAVPAMAASFVF